MIYFKRFAGVAAFFFALLLAGCGNQPGEYMGTYTKEAYLSSASDKLLVLEQNAQDACRKEAQDIDVSVNILKHEQYAEAYNRYAKALKEHNDLPEGVPTQAPNFGEMKARVCPKGR